MASTPFSFPVRRFRNVQIGLPQGPCRRHLICFVSLEAVKGEPVLLRIDGHGAQTSLVGGAEDRIAISLRLRASSLRIGLVFFISRRSVRRAEFYIVSCDEATQLQFFRFRELIIFLAASGDAPGGVMPDPWRNYSLRAWHVAESRLDLTIADFNCCSWFNLRPALALLFVADAHPVRKSAEAPPDFRRSAREFVFPSAYSSIAHGLHRVNRYFRDRYSRRHRNYFGQVQPAFPNLRQEFTKRRRVA